jgi:predicted RNA-binding Zn-ribbon protein involved in translation (DUF1610 family)
MPVLLLAQFRRFNPPDPGLVAIIVELLGGIVVICLLAILATVLGVVKQLWSDYRASKNRPGMCTGCGYDLRASRSRCPECGRAIPVRPYAVRPLVRLRPCQRRLHIQHPPSHYPLVGDAGPSGQSRPAQAPPQAVAGKPTDGPRPFGPRGASQAAIVRAFAARDKAPAPPQTPPAPRACA